MASITNIIDKKLRAINRQVEEGINLQEQGLDPVEIGQTQQGLNKLKAGKEVSESVYMDISDVCDRLEAGE